MFTFTTTMQTDPETFTARFIELSDEAVAALAAKVRMRVKGTLNGVPFQTSLAKYRDTGYVFPVKQSLREAMGVAVGDRVVVEIEPNLEDRPTLPKDVATLLAANPAAHQRWEALPPSHQREHLHHIEEAKKAETRAKRVQRLFDSLTS